MNLFLRLFFLFIFLQQGIISSAQPGILEGLLQDSDTKSPITGASINLGVTNKSDNTDAFGTFRFVNLAPGQYELIASHIGYRTEIVPVEIKAGIASTIAVQMRKSTVDLSEIKLNSKKTNSFNSIGQVDIRLRPINSSQDILRMVPGLFIAQHAGGGKAEQLFLRGFDIDHGTDIGLSVDGMPVNMVSHAHGQGYADLHFVIPETIDRTVFDLGPYASDKGNMATAGFVDFHTKDFLEKNMVKTEAGSFNSRRIATLLKITDKEFATGKRQLYMASEYAGSDGYFESPQNFHRINLLGKYNVWNGNQSNITIITSVFDSRWNASGQVPQRAIANGDISRYGAIDNTEGGNTSRINLTVRLAKQWRNNWKVTGQVYYVHYHFNLYSNFTFFLEDSVDGDQIRQRESRDIIGTTATAARTSTIWSKKTITSVGTGFRMDNIRDNQLSRTVRRKYLSLVQKGDVGEINAFSWWDQKLELNDKLSFSAGIRADYFHFIYRDELSATGKRLQQHRTTLSPKLNLQYSPSNKLKLYLSTGVGFHSNDTRVVLEGAAKDILPKVFGTDIGIILKPIPSLVVKATAWQLLSEQEFVYVGDAGIVEPGGRTTRLGMDLSVRQQLRSWLYADMDINITRARAMDNAKGSHYVPLAPSFTSTGGLTVKLKNGFSSSVRYRFIDDRPATEDYSATADGYFLLDMVMSWRIRKWQLLISMENIADSDWREAQFYTTSRLRYETLPVSEIHFTPGSPRFIKAGVQLEF